MKIVWNKGMRIAAAVSLFATACSNEGGSESLTRAAAPLRPGKVDVVMKGGDVGASSANQGALKAEGGVVRTARPVWKFEYNLAHGVIATPELKQDVSQWGVRVTVKDATGRLVDSHEKKGLEGEAALKLGDKEGLYSVEVGAYDLSGKGNKEALGAPRAFKILRDATAPQATLTVRAIEDLAAKKLRVTMDLAIKDGDTRAPACGPVRLLSAGDETVAEVPTSPTGKEWDGPSAPGSWSLARSKDLGFTFAPATARLTCADPTGNPAEIVVALSGVQKESLQPQLTLVTKGGVEAVPRKSPEGKKRLFLMEGRKLKLDFALQPAGSLPLDPVVAAKKRNDYAVSLEARRVDAPESEPATVVWSGTPKESMDLDLPVSFVGGIDLVLTLLDASGGQGDKRSVISRTLHSVYLPPSVTPALEILPVSAFVPAKKGAKVELVVMAVSDGRPFESGEFPVLEMTEDGQTWTPIAGAAFSVVSVSAPSTGAERWKVAFTYPFPEEKALRFRVSGALAPATTVRSAATRRVLGGADASLASVPSGERSACAGKSKLSVKLASAFACRVGSDLARVTVLLQNRGAEKFTLSTDSMGAKRQLGWAVWSGDTRLEGGYLAIKEEDLNAAGLDGQVAVPLELPVAVLQTGAARLVLDQEPTLSHSFLPGSYCYSAGNHPTVTLRENDAGTTVAPFRCEDY